MKALVLTYDKYSKVTEHMIECYEKVWPSNNFTFKIPYQELKTDLIDKYDQKVELVKSDSGILSTIRTLIEGLDDEQWIYWCIDDRYPIKIDKRVKDLFAWLHNEDPPHVDGVCFTYNKNDLHPENIDYENKITLENSDINLYSIKNYQIIWFHQFLRVKVLRELLKQFPKEIKQAKEMDYYKNKAVLPDDFNRYLCTEQLAQYGESTSRGELTINCAKSMQKHGIEIPEEFDVADKVLIKGKKTFSFRFIYLKILKYFNRIKN